MSNNEINTSIATNTYPAGVMLFEEGDPGSRMYVIRKGSVRIFRKGNDSELLLAILETGEFFGEMALLENLPRSACAETVEECELIEVDSQTFENMIRNNSEITLRIMQRLAGRVRELDLRLQNLLLDSGLGRAVEI
ncbi:cyclic nucleotide-binding domain-containing protein, partial [Myxococcota bacterium]|nr:cyclic nucleotide-binding domain-containing protein [Myxococcota bacterium]